MPLQGRALLHFLACRVWNATVIFIFFAFIRLHEITITSQPVTDLLETSGNNFTGLRNIYTRNIKVSYLHILSLLINLYKNRKVLQQKLNIYCYDIMFFSKELRLQ